MRIELNIQNNMSRNLDFVRNLNVFFDIDFPILFSFESGNDTYLGYTMDYDYLDLTAEFIVTLTSEEILIDLLSQKKSIRNALVEENKVFFKMNMAQSNLEIVEIELREFENDLPNYDYMLDYAIPNKRDIRKLHRELVYKCKKNLESFVDSIGQEKENQISYKNQIQRNEKNNKKLFEKIAISKLKELINDQDLNTVLDKEISKTKNLIDRKYLNQIYRENFRE